MYIHTRLTTILFINYKYTPDTQKLSFKYTTCIRKVKVKFKKNC